MFLFLLLLLLHLSSNILRLELEIRRWREGRSPIKVDFSYKFVIFFFELLYLLLNYSYCRWCEGKVDMFLIITIYLVKIYFFVNIHYNMPFSTLS